MGPISIDPGELAAAGASLRSVAASFDGSRHLSIGPVGGPPVVAAELPGFTGRWTGWISELEAVIADLGDGLSAASAYYEQRELDIANWSRP